MKFISKTKKEYAEIWQSKKIQLAFCNRVGDNVKALFYWVNCRDFFTDVLYAEEEKEVVKMYGFKYYPEKQKIDRDKLRIVIRVEKEEDVENIESNLSILRRIEASNSLEKSTLTKIKKGVYLYEGDKFWLNTSFSLSLYTFLIKVMGYKFKDNMNWIEELQQDQGIEGDYLRTLIPEFEEMINSSLVKLFSNPTTIHGFTKDIYISYIHNSGGFVSLFKKNAVNNFYMTTNDYYKRLKEILNGKA